MRRRATPAGSEPTPVACLMLNMGANHRIGPHRINVKLARQFAERGVSSIRFDLSGLGDSGLAPGARTCISLAKSGCSARPACASSY